MHRTEQHVHVVFLFWHHQKLCKSQEYKSTIPKDTVNIFNFWQLTHEQLAAQKIFGQKGTGKAPPTGLLYCCATSVCRGWVVSSMVSAKASSAVYSATHSISYT